MSQRCLAKSQVNLFIYFILYLLVYCFTYRSQFIKIYKLKYQISIYKNTSSSLSHKSYTLPFNHIFFRQFIPEQVRISLFSMYPFVHEHRYPPIVLLQRLSASHLCVPLSHSLISIKRKMKRKMEPKYKLSSFY